MSEQMENPFSGDLGIRLGVITDHEGEYTYEVLEKHFGDRDQWTKPQYKFSPTGNYNYDYINRWTKDTKEYLPEGYTAEDFKYIPTMKVDGRFVPVFEQEEFLDFYEKYFPDQYNQFGTNYEIGAANFSLNQAERVKALQAQRVMFQVFDIFKKNSVEIDEQKLSGKINDYELSPEKEEKYKRLSVEQASEIGVPYKDPDGTYFFKYFDVKSGGLLKDPISEGSIKKGKLKDGKFVIDGEGDLLAVFKNGNLNYQNLVVENNLRTKDGNLWFEGGIVQLADGTKKKIPSVVTLSHDKVKEGLSVGFYDGNLKVKKDYADTIFPKISSEYDVDEEGNVLIEADESLEYIVNSPVIQIKDKQGEVSTGYAGAGMLYFKDYQGLYDVTSVDLNTGEESDAPSRSASLGDFYYKDKENRVRFLNEGNTTLAHRDVAINEQGSITWKGKAVSDGMSFLTSSDVVNYGWTPVVYDNGKYDFEIVQDNGWVYSSNDGWFFRSNDEEGEWRWYGADGSVASDTESNNGIWLFTNDEMLSKDVQQFVTRDDLAVYKGTDGAWRSWTSSEVLDTDGSGTYDEIEMLDHLKYQRGEQLDEGKFTQEEYDSSISEIDEKINVINQQPVDTDTDTDTDIDTETGTDIDTDTETGTDTDTSTETSTETGTDTSETAGVPAYWTFAGHGGILEGLKDENGNLIGSYSIYDADGNYIDKQLGQPTDLPSEYDYENEIGIPVYYTTQISAGKKLYNIHDGDGNLIDQQDTVPDIPSYNEKRQEWIDSGKSTDTDTGWGEAGYQSLDLKNSEFETSADGSIRLINPVFTGDVLQGDAAVKAAERDANNLARLAATAPGSQAGLSTKMISAGFDKLLGPDWNPIRWLNKLNGAEYQIDLAQTYTRAQNAAAQDSSSNQNLATYVGAGQLAGKPWLNPGATIQEQAAPFLQRKYVLNKDTGELEENLLYDPSLSDFIYNKGEDGIEGTDDDFEQMWTPSWLLPWDYRNLEAEWRVGYQSALQEQQDYFNKPITTRSATQNDVDMGRAEKVGDPIGMSAYDIKQEEGMQALYDRGFYNDPNKIYKVTDPNNPEGVSYVDYKGNAVLDPGESPPGGFQEYKKGLYDQLVDDRYTWEFGDEKDVNSRMGRRKQFKEAEEYYNTLNKQLEELANNKKLENRARLYNFGADTSSKAAARQDAFNNTAKAILYGGQGISKNMFERQEPAAGYDFFGNKKADPEDPFQVAAGGNIFNLKNGYNTGQSPEQVLLNEGFTLPEIPEGNIFLKDRTTPTTTTKTTTTTTP
jgi:hypothetical protein